MTAPNQNLEEDLIGLLLDWPDRYFDVAERLRPEHFQIPFCRAAFAAITAVHREGVSFTLSMVEDRIERAPQGVTVSAYLARLKIEAQEHNGVHVEQLADKLVKAFDDETLMQTAHAAPKIIRAALDKGEDVVAAAATLIAKITGALPDRGGAQSFDLVDLLKASARRLADRSDGTEDKSIVRTGIGDLDAMIGGFRGGELIVAGGASGFGKTALATQIAYYVAMCGLPVDMFQLEMGAEQLADRQMVGLARIPARLMRGGGANVDEIERALEAADRAEKEIRRFFKVRAFRGGTMAQVRTIALGRKAREGRLGLLVIDHSKLIRTGGSLDAGPLIPRMAAAYEMAKDLAKEVDTPVLMLSQLTREGLKQGYGAKRIRDLRPRRDYLYGGGDPVEFADMVLLGHRPAEEWRRCEPSTRSEEEHAEWHRQLDYWENKAEIIVDKFRGGREGRSVTLIWNGDATRFDDMPALEPGF